MTTLKPLTGRIALVAGATRGAGRAIAVQLGAAGATVYGNGQSLSSGQLAKEYGFTDADGSRPDAWGYITDVVLGGKDAPAADYR